MLRIIIGSAVLMLIGSVHAATTLRGLPSAEEHRQLIHRLPSLFEGRDNFPEGQAQIKLEKQLTWSGGESEVLMLPLTVRFGGVVNSYCRLATMSKDFQALKLVEVPERANFDGCSGVVHVSCIDINGDGVLDVIEMVSVKSAAAATRVVVPLVYLSTSTRSSGYCYSETASRQLDVADTLAPDSVKKSLDAARRRLKIAQFDCA